MGGPQAYLINYSLAVDNATNRLLFTIGNGWNSNPQVDQVMGQSNLGVNQWIHVAAVRSR